MYFNPSLSAGELIHTITLQSPNYDSGDSRGESVQPSSWTPVRTTRARIYTAGGKETSQASQIVSEVSHVVKLRWTSLPSLSGWQVVFGSRVFTVKYAENIEERNRVLLLYCMEIDGGGQ